MKHQQCNINEYGACCCTCEFLIPMWSHPCTDGKSISNHVGWCCTILEKMSALGGVYANWHLHGMCEMHTEERNETRLRFKQGLTITDKDV